MTGGLAAVHAPGRSRDAVWDLSRRRRSTRPAATAILLWFNLLTRRGRAGASPRCRWAVK